MQQPQRIVSAAVIDKHDLTAGRDTPGLLQTPQLTAKHLCGSLNDFLFVITGYYQIQDRRSPLRLYAVIHIPSAPSFSIYPGRFFFFPSVFTVTVHPQASGST